MSLGAENNNKYLNILKTLSSGEIKKLGGQRGNSILNLQGETKYSDDNNILDLSYLRPNNIAVVSSVWDYEKGPRSSAILFRKIMRDLYEN